jgi:aspartyl-tRNA(Asn)/glutamyl-tRNA(Gln) amidotransferase subunit C
MIQQDETKSLAWMARIAVEESALPEYQEKLNIKLDSYSPILTVPTENVAKTVNPSRLKTVLRKDVEVPSMSLDDALKNAPEFSESSFKIPKIL